MSLPSRVLGGLLDRVLTVVLTVAALQLPVYYGQYLQVLTGVRLEAEARYLELKREAEGLHLDIEQFIVRHELNPDPVFQASGRIHRSTLERFQRADQAWRELSSATPLQKPVTLYRNFDPSLHEALSFEPGLPHTLEAVGWAGAGLLLSALIGGLFRALFGAGGRPRRNSQQR
jgi:hypothetical protein